MLEFSSNLKMYLFKDKDRVSFSIKVSDSMVSQYNFTITEFENLLENWNKPEGLEFKTSSNHHWSVGHKTRTPRPERAETSYVRLSVFANGFSFHHRVDYIDMYNLQKDYFYQKNNVMYWD